MNDLPTSKKLPIHHLAAIFNNTATSYKFYWFYAILQIVKQNRKEITIPELITTMISSVWYSVHFYKLSFGKQDKLVETILEISKSEYSILDIDKKEKQSQVINLIIEFLKHHPKAAISKKILNLGNYVPYRFIRPWCNEEIEKGLRDGKLNRRIKEVANHQHETLQIPYYFEKNKIIINHEWFDYFKRHLKIVEDFCLWNLLKYLQKRNPNVPNIAGKLFPPDSSERSLAKERKHWQFLFKKMPQPFVCIFSNKLIETNDFALDHFIPWSFVTHNQLWNLVPIIQSVNSSKSDKLPNLTSYFEKFAQLQYQAFQIGYEHNKKKILEDYLGIVGHSLDEIHQLSQNDFTLRLERQIQPLNQIAQNMGFSGNWIYQT